MAEPRTVVGYCQSCGRSTVFVVSGDTLPLRRCLNELCRGVLGYEPPKTIGHGSSLRGIGQHDFDLTENDKRFLRSLRIALGDEVTTRDDAA